MTPTEIKQIRKSRSLTQKELADLLGCSIRSIQNWEQGERPVSGIAASAIKRMKLPVGAPSSHIFIDEIEDISASQVKELHKEVKKDFCPTIKISVGNHDN